LFGIHNNSLSLHLHLLFWFQYVLLHICPIHSSWHQSKYILSLRHQLCRVYITLMMLWLLCLTCTTAANRQDCNTLLCQILVCGFTFICIIGCVFAYSVCIYQHRKSDSCHILLSNFFGKLLGISSTDATQNCPHCILLMQNLAGMQVYQCFGCCLLLPAAATAAATLMTSRHIYNIASDACMQPCRSMHMHAFSKACS